MKFLIILKTNIKRLLKNKKNVLISYLLPAIIILIFGFIFSKLGSNTVAVIVSDKASYGEEFAQEMGKSMSIKVYKKEDALEQVKMKKLSACYEIPENFTMLIEKGEKPQIISYKIDTAMEPGDFQFYANSIIDKMLLREEFKNSGQNVTLNSLSYQDSKINVVGQGNRKVGDIVVLNIIISFVLYSAMGISTDLFKLIKQNILKRSFTTANKPGTIIGGVLVSLFIVSSIAYSSIFLLSSYLFSPSNFDKAPLIVLNIVFILLVALSLGVFITRIIKNESLLTIILQIIISLTCFIGGSFMPIEYLPKSISMFSKFTPQYWALQSINTGNVWVSFIVLLFAIALFTAGTFKTKAFM